jgi:hypothetical protein
MTIFQKSGQFGLAMAEIDMTFSEIYIKITKNRG